MRRRQLAQVLPTGTTAESLFQLTEAAPFDIDLINIVNTTTGDVDVTLCHDADGTDTVKGTSLIWEHTLVKGASIAYERPISGYTTTESVTVKCSVAEGANFTAYGTIQGERL